MIIGNEYNTSAMECARYIFDSDCEQVGYQNFIEEGNDPRDHILYHAAVVLGQDSEFQTDIDEYIRIEAEYNETSNT